MNPVVGKVTITNPFTPPTCATCNELVNGPVDSGGKLANPDHQSVNGKGVQNHSDQSSLENSNRDEESNLSSNDSDIARHEAEAEAAADRARQEVEAQAAADRARQEVEAQAAADRARQEVEAQAAADRARQEVEAQAAADRARQNNLPLNNLSGDRPRGQSSLDNPNRDEENNLFSSDSDLARQEAEAQAAADRARQNNLPLNNLSGDHPRGQSSLDNPNRRGDSPLNRTGIGIEVGGDRVEAPGSSNQVHQDHSFREGSTSYADLVEAFQRGTTGES
jgi:hypothetical protein